MAVKKRNVMTILAASLLFSLCLRVEQGAASTPKVDRVVVVKSEHVLKLLKDGEVVKSYPVALGKKPEGPKMRQGDKKTPEGTYIVDRRNPNSRFYRSLHISYPNKSDLETARKLGASPGGDIMIHGLPRGVERMGELHTVLDWTDGCIAVTNAQMDEIWRLVPNGVSVEIRP